MKLSCVLAVIMSVGIFVAGTAHAAVIAPTAAFSTRHIFGSEVLVGTPQSHILEIKGAGEGEDRTVLEFNLAGQAVSSVPVYLNFYMLNLDIPVYTTLSLYAFEGNGLIDPVDFHRKDIFVTSFSDYGVVIPFSIGLQVPFSLDVTSQFNQFVTGGKQFLSFLFLVDTPIARYRLNCCTTPNEVYDAISLNTQRLANNPPLPAVPEPSSLTLLALGTLGVLGRGWRRRRASDGTHPATGIPASAATDRLGGGF